MRYIVLIALALGACTTNSAGVKVVDPQVLADVQTGAKIICGVAPAAGAIANLYTNNQDVKTTEGAIALACAAAVPNSVVSASVAPPPSVTPAASVSPN